MLKVAGTPRETPGTEAGLNDQTTGAGLLVTEADCAGGTVKKSSPITSELAGLPVSVTGRSSAQKDVLDIVNVTVGAGLTGISCHSVKVLVPLVMLNPIQMPMIP